jgi:hypothetical protein
MTIPWNHTSQYPEENMLHFFVLSACPLLDCRYPFLEVPKTRIMRHHLKMSVQFIFANDIKTPFDQMVLEDAFVELV